ncbi:hypothetical protein ANN_19713 [Periplaneta americana]|uniref:DDE-1 domain-containing protein n=1 Tax=Periplaneta americana TaxID=6978 RepID=A0ABQ8SAU7_PERAM|nr:hypothetical protein ANN_19713 [Periplaneta americana]
MEMMASNSTPRHRRYAFEECSSVLLLQIYDTQTRLTIPSVRLNIAQLPQSWSETVRLTRILEFGKDAATMPPRGFEGNLSILLNEGCDWLLTREDKISVIVRKTFIYDSQLVGGSRRYILSKITIIIVSWSRYHDHLHEPPERTVAFAAKRQTTYNCCGCLRLSFSLSRFFSTLGARVAHPCPLRAPDLPVGSDLTSTCRSRGGRSSNQNGEEDQKSNNQERKKQVGSIASGERGMTTTAVCCASAAGQYIPPMLIFKPTRAKDELMDGAPPGTVFAFNPDNGYVNKELFVKYLYHFIDTVKSSNDHKVLLLLDGHTTHTKNPVALDLARQ